MGRVGWATVIGVVFGVMLFGILQRGCDAEGTGGVEVLSSPATTDSQNANAGAQSRGGLSIAPGPAPERAVSGPTSPPRGTPQRLQIGARNTAAARANDRAGAIADEESNANLEWLRQQREQALANQRARDLARQTAEDLRRRNEGANTGRIPAPRPPQPVTPSNFGGETFVEQQILPEGEFIFDSLALPAAPSSFDRGEFSGEGGDTALEGVDAGDSSGSDSAFANDSGSVTVRGGTPTPINNDDDDDDDDDGDGDGDGGETPVQAPAAPALATPADAAQDLLPTLTLSWSVAARATTYTVEVSTTSDFGTTAFSQAGVTGTSVAIPTGRLSPGTTYFWRVLALNSAGQTPSAARTFATLAAPGAFSVASPANNATGVRTPVSLSWSASTGAVSYSVIIASDAAFTQVVLSESGLTETGFDVPEGVIEEGRDYWWRVLATNAAGSAIAQPSAARFTTLGAPEAFALVNPTNNATQVLIPTPLAWTPSRFAATYQVEVATDEAFTNRVVNRAGVVTPTTILTASDIQPGTTYWWRVTAENDIDLTGSSQTFTFTTAPLPGEFSLTTPANNASVGAPVTLRWSESERALLYVVQVSTDQNFANLLVDEIVIPLLTGETAFTIEDGVLQTGQRYYWRVEAQNEVGVRNAATPVFSFTIRTTDFDINGDGRVDVRDLYAFHAASPTPDVNLDGQVNNDDRLALRNRIRQSEKTEVSSGRTN
jgi:hypothetical protein